MFFKMVYDLGQICVLFAVLVGAFASGIVSVVKDLPPLSVAPSPVATDASTSSMILAEQTHIEANNECVSERGSLRLWTIWVALMRTPLNGDDPDLECFEGCASSAQCANAHVMYIAATAL